MPKTLSSKEASRIVTIRHAKLTPEERSENARKMNKARWDKWRLLQSNKQ